MKKFSLAFLLLFLASSSVFATNMVNVENFLTYNIAYTGLPDFIPFSYYVNEGGNNYVYDSAFIKPMNTFMEKYGFKLVPAKVSDEDVSDVKLTVLKASSGDAQMFIGAYANTKLFSGLQLIYPASLANPIHLIALPDTAEKIKTSSDLKNFKGIACKQEYFSDFVSRKFNELNITYVETPYQAYEQIILGQADYLLGSLYFNKIMTSRYGVADYFSYSQKPLFKIPVFVGLSKMTPLFSQYMKAFKSEFSKPEFASAVKNEILRIVEQEEEKNRGTVPPSFVKNVEIQPIVAEQSDDYLKKNNSRVVEEEIHQKTIDEVLDGI